MSTPKWRNNMITDEEALQKCKTLLFVTTSWDQIVRQGNTVFTIFHGLNMHGERCFYPHVDFGYGENIGRTYIGEDEVAYAAAMEEGIKVFLKEVAYKKMVKEKGMRP